MAPTYEVQIDADTGTTKSQSFATLDEARRTAPRTVEECEAYLSQTRSGGRLYAWTVEILRCETDADGEALDPERLEAWTVERA